MKPVPSPQPKPSLEPEALSAPPLLDEVKVALRKASVETSGRPPRLLIAFSGGLDSTVLLHLISQLRDQGEATVAAAYYHHGWRGTPPPELARIHKTALQLRVPLFFIPPEGKETPTEAMARQYRYNKLSAVALQWEADALLTAHHQDDQIETILFRLLRGTGLEGLEGIRHRLSYRVAPLGDHPTETMLEGSVTIVRPLLNIRRQALEAYAQAHQLAHFDDPTNQQTRFSRNTIRHDIWPRIEKAFPHAGKALLRMAHVTRGDLDLLEEVTQTHWEEMAQPDPDGSLRWRLAQVPVSQLTVPHQRRLLRHWLKTLALPADFADVERLVTFIRQAHQYRSRAPKLSMGLSGQGEQQFAVLQDGYLSLKLASSLVKPARPTHTTDIPWPEKEIVRVPISDPTGDHLHIEPVDWNKLNERWTSHIPSPKAKKVWVNLEKDLVFPLVLRTRRSGDQIQPVGFPKATSLKRYLIHQKVPVELRDTLPLIACGNQILWIPGLAISEALWVDDCRLPTHSFWLGPLPIVKAKPYAGLADDLNEESDDEVTAEDASTSSELSSETEELLDLETVSLD